MNSLKAYKNAAQSEHSTSPSCQDVTLVPSPASSHRTQVPKEPQFVGPTRSAFGIIIAKRSLTRMGFPDCDSLPPSGAQSPTSRPKEANAPQNLGQLLSGFTACEVTRLVNVWREEVEPVYPCVDMGERISDAQYVLDCIRAGRLIDSGERRPARCDVTTRDVDFVKVAMATTLVLESHGATELSTAIIDSVERVVSRISCLDVDLGKVQLLAMLVASPSLNCYIRAWLLILPRASITSTSTRSCWRGGRSASPREQPSRWAYILETPC